MGVQPWFQANCYRELNESADMTRNFNSLFRQALGSNVAILGLNFANVALTSLFAGLSTRGAVTAIMAYPPLLASICCFGLHLGFVYLTQGAGDGILVIDIS